MNSVVNVSDDSVNGRSQPPAALAAGGAPPTHRGFISASREGRWGTRILVGAVIVWFAVLILAPIAALVWGTYDAGLRAALAALRTPTAREAFNLTIGVTVAAVLINTFFGVVLALVLARQRFGGKLLLEGLIDLPFSVSPVVAGFMFIVLFGPQGWLGRWFEAGGIRIVFAVPGIVLATIFVTLPFVTRELVPVLRECGLEQEEAARTLGANGWQTFWRVTLPSVRWGLGYGITLTVARALGEFGAVLVVSGSIIGKTQTATLFIHQEFTDFHYEGAFAASLVLAAVSFCLLVAMELIQRRMQQERN
jgi:sulfate transport system permease protein